jgi:hypothetical protein
MTSRCTLTILCCVLLARATGAQTVDAVTCETKANDRKAAWAKTEHSWFETMLELQARELELSRCRMQASSGEEKLRHAEDFGRILLTGEGLHPVVSTIAPGNGLAGGAALAHEWNSSEHPLRYRADLDGRVSVNQSWTAGGAVDFVGSSPSISNRHMHATADASYTHIAEMSFFGIGPGSPSDEALFGLNLGVGRFTFFVPVGGIFELFGQVEGLHAAPLSAPAGADSSIETRFSTATAPGIGQSTNYGVVGGGASLKHPEDESLTGYATDLSAAVRRYQEASGRPYSFTRLDAGWNNKYTPDTGTDLGTMSVNMRLSSTVAGGDQMPFYLMPTLGGSDINGESSLRSFHDYRFRAPHALVGELGYAHTIYDPIGAFGFYDLGTVANRFSDLGGTVKHSAGIGLTVRVGGLVFAELYYAFGGGEGSRTSFTGNTNPPTATQAVRGAF